MNKDFQKVIFRKDYHEYFIFRLPLIVLFLCNNLSFFAGKIKIWLSKNIPNTQFDNRAKKETRIKKEIGLVNKKRKG